MRPRPRGGRALRLDLRAVGTRIGGSPIAQVAAIVLVGGLSVGACLAAAIPGARVLGAANRYTPYDLKGGLSQLSQRTTVYDAAGNEMGVLGIEDRQPVALAEVPDVVIDAVVATEDRTFWENPGVDLSSLFRAFVENVTSGEIEQGGSTISQQLVKNRVLTSSRDLDRKVRELILAYRLNDAYTKEEILEEYLNTVYFGQGAYGIKSAGERFFRFVDPATGQERGKRLDELDIADAALLAGVISNPEGDNPFVDPERARARRAEVLDLEVDAGYLTRVEADFAGAAPLPTLRPPSEFRPQNYWVEEVQRRLLADERLGETEAERRETLLRGGLKVHSTLDPETQYLALAAINEELPNRPVFTAALVSIEPSTGFVRAMVGGPGFELSQYNIATYPPGQQAGSTWKVITLAAALENGFSPNDAVDGSSPCTVNVPDIGRQTTRNAEGGGGGTIRRATTGSVNCAFARLSVSVGLDEVIDTAHRLGISQDTLRPYLTLTLGVFESTPLEMATVGATLVNRGVRLDPTFVERVEGPDGEVIFDERDRTGVTAVSPETAACELDLLEDVVRSGTGTAARLDRQVAAGKTGTTDKRADASFLGLTPQLVSMVWYGSPLADIPGAGFGGQTPARIWRAFMDSYLEGQTSFPFPEPGPMCDAPGGRVTELGRDSRPPPRPPPPTEPVPPVPGPAPVSTPTIVLPFPLLQPGE